MIFNITDITRETLNIFQTVRNNLLIRARKYVDVDEEIF